MPHDGSEPVFIFVPVPEHEDVTAVPSVDPVCGRLVAPGTGAGTLKHGGVRTEFCSLECTRAFAEDPERYRAA